MSAARKKASQAELALSLLVRRLGALCDPFSGSCSVPVAHKVAVGPYVQSWVLPLAEALLARERGGEAYGARPRRSLQNGAEQEADERRLEREGKAKAEGWPSLARTAAALEEWERTEAARDQLLDAATTDDKLGEWKRAEREALEKVAEAFFQDTKDRNSRENCSLVGLRTLREWVATWREVERLRQRPHPEEGP